MPEIDSGNTAWVLISAALVLLMTPGLAFFYGGLVRAKSVLNMLMMNFICLAIVTVVWVLYGYSVAFAPDVTAGLFGGFDYVGLSGLVNSVTNGLPDMAFVAFQLMFAIITVALITGSIADRTRFWAWSLFIVLWVTLVYFPVAHWVFAFDVVDDDGVVTSAGGWIANQLGALDFAGGTAVHINAGSAALALALVLGKRIGWRREAMRPHNVPFVLLGASLLWFGWFGFNAGSALGLTTVTGNAFVTTAVATAAAIIGWLIVEQIRDKHPTTVGAASGAVAGLVAITPACAFVNAMGALAIGLIAGVICALAISLKYKLGYDDSLDVVGVHLVGGLVGTLSIGFFATLSVNDAGGDGLFAGGGLELLGKQAVAAVAVMAYSFVVTFILGKIIDMIVGFRVSEEEESTGIDAAEHAESGYEIGALGGGIGRIG